MNTPEVNAALMARRAKDLAQLLTKLNWPEIHGPYFPRVLAPHVIQSSEFTVAVNYQTAMFTHRDSQTFRFVDIPTDPGLDITAWLATAFCDWVTTREKAIL